MHCVVYRERESPNPANVRHYTFRDFLVLNVGYGNSAFFVKTAISYADGHGLDQLSDGIQYRLYPSTVVMA